MHSNKRTLHSAVQLLVACLSVRFSVCQSVFANAERRNHKCHETSTSEELPFSAAAMAVCMTWFRGM